jgi:hypothetical protein
LKHCLARKMLWQCGEYWVALHGWSWNSSRLNQRDGPDWIECVEGTVHRHTKFPDMGI